MQDGGNGNGADGARGESVGYARRLGVWDATMLVVGGVIGAGIFLNPKYVALSTSNAHTLIAVWVAGGILAFIGALCFAELGARRPQAGGGYVYLREAYGPLVAFVYGWIMFAVNYSASMAAVSRTFASYFCTAIGLPQTLVTPLAVGAIVLLTGINIAGVRPGATVQNVITILKLIAVAAVVVTGLAFALPAPTAPVELAPSTAIGAALLPVLFSYGGWAYINNVAGEISAPQRNIPRALALGMLIVMTCYIGANLAYERALGHAGLAGSSAPAAEVMQVVFGSTGATVIALGIAASTLGFCNVSLLGGARVFQVMGADGMFFEVIGRLHPRFRTPHIALIAYAACAIVLMLLGSYQMLLEYGTLGDWLGYAMVVTTIFFYRRRSEPAGFLAPAYPLLPALFVLAVLGVMTLYALNEPATAFKSVLAILAGVPIYYVRRWFSRRAAARG